MKSLAIVLLAVLLFSCHLEPSIDDLVEKMVVQTNYDGLSTDYSFYSSFTLSIDTLGLISNVRPVWDTLIVSENNNGFAHAITTNIKNLMTNRNYTYVDKSQNPDLGFGAYIVENYNVYQSVNYPTYYYGYYGYGYYGTPYITTYVNSSTTLVINLIDLKNKAPNGQYKVIWSALIGDIGKSNDYYTKSIEAVQQAFIQSPYLSK